MFERYLRMLSDGEEEIATQKHEQFPEGWEEAEKQRQVKDSAELKKVIQAISNTVPQGCERALGEFRNYLEPKNVIKTGKHFNAQLLIEALNLYTENYDRFGGNSFGVWITKNQICWRNVVGYIQRFIPACYAQAYC